MIYYWDKKFHVSWCEFVWSRSCMGTAEDPFFKIICNNAGERLSSWECFQRDIFRLLTISYCIHIVRTSCSQLPARSEIFCLVVEIVYWHCDLKFVYPMINLAFLGIIVKVKLGAKFCLHSFKWFCLQIRDTIFSLSCPRHCDKGLIVVIVTIFTSETKKNMIMSEVISSHLGPMYIETPSNWHFYAKQGLHKPWLLSWPPPSLNTKPL